MENLVTTELKQNILIASINRPKKLNALNRSVIGVLSDVIDDVRGNDEIKGMIIKGAGDKAFAAGADISEFQDYPVEEAMLMAKRGQEVFRRIETCPKPVIALINGFCLGGGFELALSAHIRFATPEAKFGLPEVGLGLLPGYGGTQRLTSVIGKSKAFEYILTGEMFDANEAERLGIVNEVIPADTIETNALSLLKKIGSKAPLAVAEIIKAINGYYYNENGFEQEMESFSNLFDTDDFKEGVSAFLDKRTPEFTGR